MKKRYAVISDIHGNIDALNKVLNDIKSKNVDDIFCLGDIIGIGSNSKECINKLIEFNVKSVLGEHELYLLNREKEYYKLLKKSLTEKEMDYIKDLPLFYEINIDYDGKVDNNKIVLSHYLIADEKSKQPFEKNNLKDDVNLWIKYNESDIMYIIGHLHKSFDSNKVEGISGDFIEKTGELPNIEIVDGVGDNVSYLLIEIEKRIKLEKIKIK